MADVWPASCAAIPDSRAAIRPASRAAFVAGEPTVVVSPVVSRGVVFGSGFVFVVPVPVESGGVVASPVEPFTGLPPVEVSPVVTVPDIPLPESFGPGSVIPGTPSCASSSSVSVPSPFSSHQSRPTVAATPNSTARARPVERFRRRRNRAATLPASFERAPGKPSESEAASADFAPAGRTRFRFAFESDGWSSPEGPSASAEAADSASSFAFSPASYASFCSSLSSTFRASATSFRICCECFRFGPLAHVCRNVTRCSTAASMTSGSSSYSETPSSR